MTLFEELNGVDSECRSHLAADSGEAPIVEERRKNGRILVGREKFIAAMREPRPSKPARMAEALAYNPTALS